MMLLIKLFASSEWQGGNPFALVGWVALMVLVFTLATALSAGIRAWHYTHDREEDR